MILIVDSGSTKTDWCFVSHKHTTHIIHTKGINPVVQSQEEVRQTIEVDMEVEARQKAINLNASTRYITMELAAWPTRPTLSAKC